MRAIAAAVHRAVLICSGVHSSRLLTFQCAAVKVQLVHMCAAAAANYWLPYVMPPRTCDSSSSSSSTAGSRKQQHSGTIALAVDWLLQQAILVQAPLQAAVCVQFLVSHE